MLNTNDVQVGFDEVRRQMDLWEGFNRAISPDGQIQVHISFRRMVLPAANAAETAERRMGRGYRYGTNIEATLQVASAEGKTVAAHHEMFRNTSTLDARRVYAEFKDTLEWVIPGLANIARGGSATRMSQLHRHIIQAGGLDPADYIKRIYPDESEFVHYGASHDNRLLKHHQFTDHLEYENPFYDDEVSFPEMAGSWRGHAPFNTLQGTFLFDEQTTLEVGNPNALSKLVLRTKLPESVLASLSGKRLEDVVDHPCLKGSDILIGPVKDDAGHTVIEMYDPEVYADDKITSSYPLKELHARLKAWAEA